MRSHSEGPEMFSLFEASFSPSLLCERTAKDLARLRGCAGSSESSPVAYLISTLLTWTGFFIWYIPGFMQRLPQCVRQHLLPLAIHSVLLHSSSRMQRMAGLKTNGGHPGVNIKDLFKSAHIQNIFMLHIF